MEFPLPRVWKGFLFGYREMLSSMNTLWTFFRRDFLIETSYRFAFALSILSMLPQLLMFYFVAKMVDSSLTSSLVPYGGGYFPFVLVGISLQRYLNLSLSSFSNSLRQSQLTGTLEAMLATPIKAPMFLLGSTLYSFWFNSMRILLWLIVGALLFGAKLNWVQLPLALPVFLLTILAFSSLGIFSASFIVFFKKGDPVQAFAPMASYLLGGVYFPVSLLPPWLQKLALLVPTTSSLEALRNMLLSNGAEASGVMAAALLPLLVLTIWTAIMLPLSLLCFQLALNRARAKGTLGHY